MIKLEISQEQLDLIIHALELETRLRLGQFKQIEMVFEDKKYDTYAFDYLSSKLKDIFFPELPQNQYYGIYGKRTDKKAKAMYDLFKQMKTSELDEFNKSIPYLTDINNKIIIKGDKD